jgi:hypothetical protein
MGLAKVAAAVGLGVLVAVMGTPTTVAGHREVQHQYGADQPVDWLDMLPSPGAGDDLEGMTFAKGWAPAVGLPNANAVSPGQAAAGRVLVYGGTDERHWRFVQALEPPLGAPAHFGRAVATSSAGLVVTAGDEGAGAFYVFPWGNEAAFHPLPKAVPVAGTQHVVFGASADAFQISSDRPALRLVAIGSPAAAPGGAGEVRVYRQAEDYQSWTEEARLEGPAGFGAAVALSDDVLDPGAAVLAVGAPGRDGAPGRVVVFSEAGGDWDQMVELVAPDGSPGFGEAVAMSNGMLVVGAPAAEGSGNAHAFARDASAGYAFALALRPPGAGLPATYGSAVAIDMGVAAVAAPTTDATGGLYRFLIDRETGAFLGRAGAPAEPGAGTFAEDVASAGPFAFLVSFRPADGVACGLAFHLGPKDEDAGPWPEPCLAPPAPTSSTPPPAPTTTAAPTTDPSGEGAPGAGILAATVALGLASMRRRR